MRTRHNIWILFLGIIVAILCFFYSTKQTPKSAYLDKAALKLDKQEVMAFMKPSK